MKRIIEVAILAVMIIFSYVEKAEAKPKKHFDFYMVEAEGSYDQVKAFDFSDTPWVYVHMPKKDDYRLTISWWYGTDPTLVIYGDSQDVWVSLAGGWDKNKWIEWQDIREPGTWSVSADYKYFCKNKKGHELIRFEVNPSVVPEPISSILFIVGGATLGVARLRKQSK